MLRVFVNCTMVLTKRLFSIAKGGTKTIAHLSIAEESSFWSLDMRIYNCKLRNEKKDLIQVCNEYSPQLSKLLYNWQGGTQILWRALGGLGADGFF
jgi:hypothetical protein